MLLLKKDNYKEIKFFSYNFFIHKIQSQKYQTLFDFSENGTLPHCIMQMIFAETARNSITESEDARIEIEDKNLVSSDTDQRVIRAVRARGCTTLNFSRD